MFSAFLLFIYKLNRGKDGENMLIRLYAGEIILGKITIDDVPNKLKEGVIKYLLDMGYEV